MKNRTHVASAVCEPEVTGTASVDADALAAAEKAARSDAEAFANLKRHRAERRRRRLIKRAIVAAVLVALIGLAAVGISLATHGSTPSVQLVTDQVAAGTFTSQIEDRGALEARSSIAVSPTVDGTIAEVRVSAGQTVNKGDVLMIISNPQIDTALKDAERELKGAEADLVSANKIAGRPRGADAADSGGTADALAVAQRAVETARAARDAARAKVCEKTVRAPAAGSIISMNVQVGARLSELSSTGGSSDPLMQIADLSQMKLRLQIDEEDIASVVVDQIADITFPAFEGLKLQGKVANIASCASTDSAASTSMSYNGSAANTSTFAVDLLIAEPDPRLKPGMSAEATLVTNRLDNVVMVPLVSLQSDGGTDFVMVQDDPEQKGGRRQEVHIYARNDDVAVIGSAQPRQAGSDESGMDEAPLRDGDLLVIATGSGARGTTGKTEVAS
ncbi:efflux transporter, RND family, MFP subunit [Coriobacterium glomerans PW2]|uniref:Efflux transporter, RND family, MFP subunit n=1 Tax=Coriobacterium glomerans (strain ATCC 49209 / DSM 20642 / JCM 10262 / PW2) TaxID=700015 RepID=F2N9U2_CORGP|nr:efflux RND transporter periplasmic adaptor subunit [Coriobacterium glomerans]AEB07195.1 efflux transporter, RND family, MFP subunit [Coriobacterium glomerans PW2]